MDGYRSRGASVVAIGQGTGSQAAGFAREWNVDLPILGDTRGRAYGAYGMHRGSWWTVVLRNLLTRPVETVGLIAEADMKGAALAAADVLRLGGVAIVDRAGALRFLHKAADPADIPANDEIFSALGAFEPSASR
jgi:hypothetical protein